MAAWYTTMPKTTNVISGPTMPMKISSGNRPMTALQSGITNIFVMSRIVFHNWFERVDEAHDGMLPDEGRRRRGLPFLVVAPRPGFHGSRSGSRSCSGGAAGGRRFPTDGDDSFGRSSRLRSHDVPVVLAPRSRTPAASCRSSVTTTMP